MTLHDYTVAALAEKIGLAPSTLSRRLNGSARWEVRDVQRIAILCFCPVADLVGDYEADEELLSRPVPIEDEAPVPSDGPGQ